MGNNFSNADTTVINKLFNLNTNASLFFVSLLMLVYVFISGSLKTAVNVSYLDSVGIGEAPYADFVFLDYFNFFKDSPFTIVPFFIALAPIPFLRKILSGIVLFVVAMLSTFVILSSLLIDTGEYNLYLAALQSFIKEFSIPFVGCYLIAFLIGSLLYYFLVMSRFARFLIKKGTVLVSE